MPFVIDDQAPQQGAQPAATPASRFVIEDPDSGSKMSRVAQEGLGVLRGASDPFIGASQLIMHGLNAVGVVSDDALKTHDNYYNNLEKDYQAATPDGSGIGRVAGNVLATLPLAVAPAAGAGLAARMGAGVANGAVSAGLQPVNTESSGDSFLTAKAKQIAVGSTLGAVLPAVGAGVSRVINPQTREAAQTLLDQGVRLTPGQILGGGFQRAEDAATSIPLLGDAIKNSQRQGIEDFNRAAVNRALAPIGQQVPKEASVGYDLIDQAHKKIGENYDDLLSKLKPLQEDSQLSYDLIAANKQASNMLPQYAEQFKNIINNELTSKFSANGAMDAETMKTVESQLGNFARKFGRTPDANAQMLGDAVGDAQQALRDAVERQNPEYAGQLRKANMAFAELLRVENASAKQGAQDGIFTPAQYEGAVRTLDSSVRKNSFSRGQAFGQDFATAGRDVLSSTVPDSGTALRAIGGTAAIGAINPFAAAGVVGAASLYTNPAQRALQALLTSRPDLAPEIAKHVEMASSAASLVAGELTKDTNAGKKRK